MKHIYTTFILLLFQLPSIAQTSETPAARFSLKEAIDYAVVNNVNVKNSDIDRRVAIARKGEIGAAGLPQINGNANFTHNINIQATVLEYQNGSKLAPPNPALGQYAGNPAPFILGLHNQFIPSITGSQVIFDKAFFSNIQAAKVYKELSEKNITRSKIATAHEVTKAYYGVLVNETQLAYINVNLARLDSSYLESKARLQNGLLRPIEVDRIEVSYNNLKEEKARITRIVELSKAILKFQMNLPPDTSIILTDTLHENLVSNVLQLPENEKINYSSRIEYSIIQTQSLLNKMDTRTARASRYPKLNAVAAYGFNPAANIATNIFTQRDRWYNFSYVGLSLQVPIFNGFSSHYRVQQKKLEEERTANNKQMLERNISLQVEESIINLNNSIESLKTQRRNLNLAEKNVKVSKAEFEQGIAMSLDVTIAEASFKEAQTNYYNALYNTLLSKADYERAIGTLYK
ncbi:MAG TPA: TolC family protein [Cytophagaceae bacterium]|jgi:outer membrane protein|nr:TolC family protein [Cytophagaceae bacterium]